MNNLKKASSILTAGLLDNKYMYIEGFRIFNNFKSGQSLKHFMKSCRVKKPVSMNSCVVL